jgi:hypothetical protein
MNYYAARPEAETEQGLMRLAPSPPRDDKESLIVQLWDRHLPGWRNRARAPRPRNAEHDAETRVRPVFDILHLAFGVDLPYSLGNN